MNKAKRISLGDLGPKATNLAHEFDFRRLLAAFGPQIVSGNPVVRNALRMVRAGAKTEDVLVECVKALTIMNYAIMQVAEADRERLSALELGEGPKLLTNEGEAQ